nr:hypothetical protein CFP56_71309 [Quercus suber]
MNPQFESLHKLVRYQNLEQTELENLKSRDQPNVHSFKHFFSRNSQTPNKPSKIPTVTLTKTKIACKVSLLKTQVKVYGTIICNTWIKEKWLLFGFLLEFRCYKDKDQHLYLACTGTCPKWLLIGFLLEFECYRGENASAPSVLHKKSCELANPTVEGLIFFFPVVEWQINVRHSANILVQWNCIWKNKIQNSLHLRLLLVRKCRDK